MPPPHLVDKKAVVIVNRGLPTGLKANAAAVLGVTLGARAPDLVADDLVDGSGQQHLGLIGITLPVLGASAERLAGLRDRLYASTDDLLVADFTSIAQTARTFEEYRDALRALEKTDLSYLGLGLYGASSAITKHTEGLGLLR